MFKTVIFDLDGTLIDSAPDLRDALGAALRTLGLEPVDLATTTGFIGNGVEVLVRRAIRHRRGNVDESGFGRAMAAFHDHYRRHGTDLTRPYPGVPALLEQLRSAGCALGLCTNKPSEPARAICHELGLLRFFGAVTGGDTLAMRKPDAEPLAHTMRSLSGTREGTLYVGDSAVDYQTAKAARIAMVFFEGGYQQTPIADFAPEYRVRTMAEVSAIALGT